MLELALRARPGGLWELESPEARFPPLDGDRDFDVVVAGAGIVGVTAAQMLKAAGLRVAVVEARRIADGATSSTLGILTSSPALAYRTLAERRGDDIARLHREACETGLRHVEETVRTRGIECEWTRTAAVVFTEGADRADDVEREAEALARLGGRVELATDVGLPFRVRAALRVPGQAGFHPRKYLHALAAALPGDGCAVFEGTTALDVEEGDPCEVRTDRGVLRSAHLIVASHQPFLPQGHYYARVASSSVSAAAFVVRGDLPRDLFVGADAPARSFRRALVGGRTHLIVAGESHRSGGAPEMELQARELEAWARARFDVEAVACRWASRDNVTSDGLPDVGPLTPSSRRVHVATGFSGWGLAAGTAAGLLLADAVLGRENAWSRVYDPAREGAVRRVAAVARDALARATASEDPAPPAGEKGSEVLRPGEARVVDWGYEKYAVHCDENGKYHLVAATCTHLGCLVKWNAGERSWDCPCHGSRFDPDGRVLEGPAVRSLPGDVEP